MKTEFKVSKLFVGLEWWNCDCPCFNVCTEDFARYVELPRNPKKVFFVFSDQQPRHRQWFRLVLSDADCWLEGVPKALAPSASSVCEKLYDEGYRYVWVEYENR